MLPRMTRKFGDFIAPAMAYPQVWRLVAGLGIITIVYFAFLVAVMRFASGLFRALGFDFTPLSAGNSLFSTPPEMAAALLSFAGLGIGTVFAARILHNRGPATLLGPDRADFLRCAILTFHIVFPIYALWLIVVLGFGTPVANLGFATWLVWLVPALGLLLIQVSAEEVVFRGYLQQQLAARFSSRWVWFFLPSAFFGLLHYDPGQMGPNAWLVVVDTTIIGLIAADLTARTGNLGAAICLHFVNNLFAILFVSLKGPMTGLSLYITRYGVSDFETFRKFLLWDIATYLIGYFIYLRMMARTRRK